MRQICLDTETTGMSAKNGDRVIEIGCVQFDGRTVTDEASHYYHVYINPECEVPEEAVKIHGLTTEFLADKPTFGDIIDEFIHFITGAELIIHNAEFDIGFLNAEFKRLGKGKVEDYCTKVTDSLAIAKKIFPGLKNTLDVLCARFEVDNTKRTFHGALLDAQLLTEVYLAMTRQQGSLIEEMLSADRVAKPLPPLEKFIVAQTPAEDIEIHKKFLAMIKKKSGKDPLWNTFKPETGLPPEEKKD